MRGFSSYHPVTLLIYYLLVLTITMFINMPIILILSLSGAWFYQLLNDREDLKKSMFFDLLIFLIFAVTNPVFVHRGKTLLFFMNGKPITLEAVAYGSCMAVMMVGVIRWCKAFSKGMTSDKLLYLCQGITPNLSVVLSMVLRYIPLFRVRADKVSNSQTAMGLYAGNGYMVKAKGSLRVFSIVLTWSLDNAIDTANSMKARGYGLGKRSRYSIFRWTLADIWVIIISIILAGIVMYGCSTGVISFQFYPELSKLPTSGHSTLIYLACGLFVFIPVLIELKEKLKWKLYRSRI